jgi:hypothetical protein
MNVIRFLQIVILSKLMLLFVSSVLVGDLESTKRAKYLPAPSALFGMLSVQSTRNDKKS